jgi:hypothetical protein
MARKIASPLVLDETLWASVNGDMIEARLVHGCFATGTRLTSLSVTIASGTPDAEHTTSAPALLSRARLTPSATVTSPLMGIAFRTKSRVCNCGILAIAPASCQARIDVAPIQAAMSAEKT